MSLTSKLTLLGASAFALGIIGHVHYKQYSDREQLHQGVINDIERRQKRKRENLFNLQKQIELTKNLKTAEAQEADVR